MSSQIEIKEAYIREGQGAREIGEQVGKELGEKMNQREIDAISGKQHQITADPALTLLVLTLDESYGECDPDLMAVKAASLEKKLGCKVVILHSSVTAQALPLAGVYLHERLGEREYTVIAKDEASANRLLHKQDLDDYYALQSQYAEVERLQGVITQLKAEHQQELEDWAEECNEQREKNYAMLALLREWDGLHGDTTYEDLRDRTRACIQSSTKTAAGDREGDATEERPQGYGEVVHYGHTEFFSYCKERFPDHNWITSDQRFVTCPKCLAMVRQPVRAPDGGVEILVSNELLQSLTREPAKEMMPERKQSGSSYYPDLMWQWEPEAANTKTTNDTTYGQLTEGPITFSTCDCDDASCSGHDLLEASGDDGSKDSLPEKVPAGVTATKCPNCNQVHIGMCGGK